MLASLVRVKRWGKSPPLRQQWRGHGKPRAVQGQIGGESWPGSLCRVHSSERAPFTLAQAAVRENPRVGCWSPGANRDLEE
jgi:hypothetical protein